MKKIGLLLAIVFSMGILFSATCKKDKREINNALDTTNNVVNLPAAYLKLFVKEQQATNADVPGVDAYIFPRQGWRDSSVKTGQEALTGIHCGTVAQAGGDAWGLINLGYPTSNPGGNRLYYIFYTYTNGGTTYTGRDSVFVLTQNYNSGTGVTSHTAVINQ